MLPQIVQALRWTGPGTPLIDELRAQFELRLVAAGVARIGVAGRHEPARVEALHRRMTRRGPTRMAEAMTAPDTFRFLAPDGDPFALLDHLDHIADLPAPTDTHAPYVDFSAGSGSSFDIPLITPVGMSEGARRLAERRIRAALDRLAERPAAAQCVHVHSREIAVRRDLGRDGFLSTSSPRCPGRSVLINIEAASIEMIADALLHEAIHSLLNAVQLIQPFILDHARLKSVEACSPWSDQIIPLDALLEACFVWFALWSFWRGMAGEEDRRLHDRAAHGFIAPALCDIFADAEGAIAPSALDAIDLMQARVRSGIRAVS